MRKRCLSHLFITVADSILVFLSYLRPTYKSQADSLDSQWTWRHLRFDQGLMTEACRWTVLEKLRRRGRRRHRWSLAEAAAMSSWILGCFSSPFYLKLIVAARTAFLAACPHSLSSVPHGTRGCWQLLFVGGGGSCHQLHLSVMVLQSEWPSTADQTFSCVEGDATGWISAVLWSITVALCNLFVSWSGSSRWRHTRHLYLFIFPPLWLLITDNNNNKWSALAIHFIFLYLLSLLHLYLNQDF